MHAKVIWIAWERHRRTEQLVKYLGVKYFALEDKRSRFIRHPRFIIETFKILTREKPEVLIIQNPSIILSLFACIIKNVKFLEYYLIIDSHNEGIYPYSKGFRIIGRLFGRLYRYIQKAADVTIVTNEEIEKVVKNNGGHPFVLPDKVPEPELIKNIELEGIFNYVFVCTFAKDEPLQEIIETAKKLNTDDRVYITGNYKKAHKKMIKNIPQSIVFTGYLEDSAYWGLLKKAECIIDLTIMEDCLVCGAYEAIAVGTPLILSDTVVLRSTFSKGAIYTKNDSSSLKIALLEAKNNKQILDKGIKDLKIEYNCNWFKKGQKLKELIENRVIPKK